MKYKRASTNKQVTFEQLLRLHRLVSKQTLRIGRLEERVDQLQHQCDERASMLAEWRP